MYCPNCGNKNPDSAKFCENCGSPLGSAPPSDADNPSADASPTPNTADHTTASAQQFSTVPPQQPPYYSQQPPVGAAPPQSQGCFSAAWNDLVHSPKWFGRTALLALLNAVPILNFCAEGYAMDWGREVAFERREALPPHFFGHKTMLLGLCLTVFYTLMMIFALVCSTVASIIIPILGALAGVVFTIFVTMFTEVGLIRMGVFGKFGAAFDLVEDWRAFTRKLGTLFCASCLPGIIIGLIAGVIVSILFAIGGGAALADLFTYASYGHHIDVDDVAYILRAMGIGSLILLVLVSLIAWYIAAFANMLIKLVTYRAMGHWMWHVAPEWTTAAFEEQKIYGVDFPAEPMLETLRREKAQEASA